jgi:acetoin utilization protein AcuC
MKEKLAFLFRKEINEYDFGKGHPFHGRRGEDFLRFFKEKIKIDFPILKAEKATDEDLLLICEKEYIEFTKKYFEAKSRGEEFNGRFFFYHSADNLPIGKPGKIEEAARYIIGQAKMAADLVMEGKFKKVISIGGGLHHAKKNFGEGFCIYNDVAFCAKYLIEKYNLKKILILDTDAHAGNGTSEYFYDNPKVLFIDIHQDPRTLYPGTGFVEQKGGGEGEGLKINIPLPPLSGDESYKMVFEEIIEPVVKEFRPQIIIRNGGSDPHFSDPLTNLNLTIEGFRMIGEKVKNLSEICNGKEIDLIASGYNLKSLNYCWAALISSLLGLKIKISEPMPPKKIKENLDEVKELIKKIKKEFKKYWKSLN